MQTAQGESKLFPEARSTDKPLSGAEGRVPLLSLSGRGGCCIGAIAMLTLGLLTLRTMPGRKDGHRRRSAGLCEVAENAAKQNPIQRDTELSFSWLPKLGEIQLPYMCFVLNHR